MDIPAEKDYASVFGERKICPNSFLSFEIHSTTRNMTMLAGKRASGELGHFQTSFVVMKRNIHEMASFAKLSREWNCDCVEFQRIFELVAGLENIFDIEDPGALEKLAAELENPILSEEFVRLSSLEPYKGYRMSEDKLRKRRKDILKFRLRKALSRIASPIRTLLAR